MARVRVRYLERRKLKDGGVGYVWNNRHAVAAGLQREWLGTDLGKAIERAERLNALWDQVRTKSDAKPGPVPGTVSWMIDRIEAGPDHQEKSAKLRKEVGLAFRYLEASPLARRQLAEITGSDLKLFHRKVLEAKGVSYAQRIMKWLRFLLNEAVRDKQLTASPMEGMRVKRPPPRQVLWFEDEVAAVIAQAEKEGRPSLGLAFRLAYDLGQREGDVLVLKRGQLVNGEVLLRQGKTDAMVRVPALPELQQALTAADARLPELFTNENGAATLNFSLPATRAQLAWVLSETTRRPYKQFNFIHLVGDLIEAAGFKGKTFQDLRRSSVYRLAIAGCTIPMISAITGHSYARCEQILEVYLPRTTEMARLAIERVLASRQP